MIRRFLVGVAAAMAALMALSGCAATPNSAITISAEELEDAIRTRLGPQLEAPIEALDCPENLRGAVGQKTECTMTLQGQPATVEVVVTKADGTSVDFDMTAVY